MSNPTTSRAIISVVVLAGVLTLATACGGQATPTPKPTIAAAQGLPIQAPAQATAAPVATTIPAAAATAVPAAAPTKSASTTGSAPTLLVNHAGRTADMCLTCHGPAGVKPVPANHAGRTADMCLACHRPG
jgi:hypothetical protein